VIPIGHWLSRQAARLGNWNDRQFGPELGRRPHRSLWQFIDRRIVRPFYLMGDW